MIGLIIAFIIVTGGFAFIIFDIVSTRNNTSHHPSDDGLGNFLKGIQSKQKKYTLQRKRG